MDKQQFQPGDKVKVNLIGECTIIKCCDKDTDKWEVTGHTNIGQTKEYIVYG